MYYNTFNPNKSRARTPNIRSTILGTSMLTFSWLDRSGDPLLTIECA